MTDSFEGLLAFAFLAALLLLGTVLRAHIPVLQRLLLPASLIGGLVGLACMMSGLNFGFRSETFLTFAFHFFTLSFMSLCLAGSSGGASSRSYFRGGLWLALLWNMSLVLQALVGMGVVLLYNQATEAGISEFLGIIATHGFTQGPGQALVMGTIWENQFQIQHAAVIGVIYASAGFLVAFVVGVPVARWAIGRRLNVNQAARIDQEFLQGYYARDRREPLGYQVTHPANVDSLAYHLGFLGVGYLLTDQWLRLLQQLFGDAALFGLPFGLLFSHNLFFAHGLLVCLLLRGLLDRLGWGHWIDGNTQHRITGTAVDFMMVATLLSITLGVLAEFLTLIVLVSVAITAVTAALCFGLGQRLNPFGIERALALFGCCAGSTGTGLLLLRLVDPDFSSPVARELAFFNVVIMLLGIHVLMIMAPVLPGFSLTTILLVYGGTFALFGTLLLLIARTGSSVGGLPETRQSQ